MCINAHTDIHRRILHTNIAYVYRENAPSDRGLFRSVCAAQLRLRESLESPASVLDLNVLKCYLGTGGSQKERQGERERDRETERETHTKRGGGGGVPWRPAPSPRS